MLNPFAPLVLLAEQVTNLSDRLGGWVYARCTALRATEPVEPTRAVGLDVAIEVRFFDLEGQPLELPIDYTLQLTHQIAEQLADPDIWLADPRFSDQEMSVGLSLNSEAVYKE